jgi:hypothetical protein
MPYLSEDWKFLERYRDSIPDPSNETQSCANAERGSPPPAVAGISSANVAYWEDHTYNKTEEHLIGVGSQFNWFVTLFLHLMRHHHEKWLVGQPLNKNPDP